MSMKPIQSQGKLDQYPDWEEEWDDEEMSYNEDNWEEDFSFQDDLVITSIEEEDAAVKEKLMTIPAILQNMWIRLVNGNLPLAGDEELELLHRLEKAGLVEVDESETHLFLKVKRGKADYSDYEFWDSVSKRYDLEHVLLALAGLYGVVEKKSLYELLDEMECIPRCSMELLENITDKLSHCEFWNCITATDGTTYISSFCNEITEEILHRRGKYPVKWYRSLNKEDEIVLLLGDWRELCPVYGSIYHYLFWEKWWSPEDITAFLEQLVKCVAVGYTEQEYFMWIDDVLKENHLSLTKSMRKMLLKFRNRLPSAVLKGYTWEEYEKNRGKNGYHQLSLFEEELPF